MNVESNFSFIQINLFAFIGDTNGIYMFLNIASFSVNVFDIRHGGSGSSSNSSF